MFPIWGAVVAGTLAVTMAACGGSNGVSGTVTTDGSSTVGPLTAVAAERYAEEESSVKVSVGTHGTGGGFEKFCNGEIDIANASRPIKDTEIAACQAGGVEYAALQVANDALTVVVNAKNSFVDCLTVDQLRRIWDADSTAATWRDVDPSFPDTPLKRFGPGTDSGTFDYFTTAINGEEGRSTTNYTPNEDDNVLVQGVASETGAIGYFGYTYYEENTDKLKAVPIDAGAGCVAPSKKTAQDGSYQPLSRPLFVYVSQDALGRDEVRNFVEYYIDDIDTIVDEAGFVPLTKAQQDELAAAYAQLSSKA